MNLYSRILITGASGFIGTNLLESYHAAGVEVANFDFLPPRNELHRRYWIEGNLLDTPRLFDVFREYQPDLIIHLAARTDLNGNTVGDYAANVQGVSNLLDALGSAKSVRRAVLASTMLVCRLGYQPQNDIDYCPTTAYGESKRQGEMLVRQSRLAFPWTLVRPSSIWGPWFGPPYRQFFETVNRGLYVHPKGVVTTRTYGYVGNVIRQIQALADAPQDTVGGRTFYLGDPPLELGGWADLAAREMGRRSVPRLPLAAFRAAARCGDVCRILGWKNAPLTSFRLDNMLTNYVANLEPTWAVAGMPFYSLEEGTRMTVEWLRSARQASAHPA